MIYKITILLLLLNLSFANTLFESNQNQEVTFIQQNESSINVKMKIGDITSSIIQKDNNQFLILNSDNSYYSTNIGRPKLPQYNQLIEVPAESIIQIEIIKEESIRINLDEIKILPSQPSLSKSNNNEIVEFYFDNEVYQNNKFINNNIIDIENKGKMREVEIANINIKPINYNPVLNQLIIYTDIEFNIIFEKANFEQTRRTKHKYASPYFEGIFENSLINYSSPYSNLTRDNDFIEDNVKYVIVANQTFEGYLDEFIEWKSQKGYNVVVGYTSDIGSSSNAIKSFIENEYNSSNPASFVLLVGDTQQLPASYSSGGHVSDLDYCDFTNDNIPDVLCGRFSAETPNQLLTQIEKTIQYEKYEMPNPSFLSDVIMISGVDASFAPTYGNGQINYGNEYYFNNSNNINSETFLYPASGSAGSQILNLANQGASLINYTAHGYESGWADPAFDNSDVNSMSNNGKYPTMIGNCCLTNAFDSGTCFGEALLRKANGGAIGYIGGSDVTYWDEDFWWGVGSGTVNLNPNYNSTGPGAYDGMFHENNESNWAIVNAAIMMVGNLAVAQANGMDDYYWEIYHLMGDPSLSTFLGIPSTNIVNYSSMLPIGSEAIEIQAQPYSYVGLTQNGEFISGGLVGPSGYAVLVFDPINVAGILDLTVTAQNTQPFFGEIIVSSPDGAFVTVNNIEVNYGDDNTISPGETINIDIEVENLGNESSELCSVALTETTNSDYIIFNDSQCSETSINAGATFTFDCLSFTISNDAPYGYNFNLELNFESENNTSSTNLNMTVEALIENFESGTWHDGLSWNISNGDSDWVFTMGGAEETLYTSKSGEIEDNMSSELSINMDIAEPGQISFYKKVSCEDVGEQSGNYYDYLAFYINNIEQNKWAGEQDWSLATFNVSEGNHTFTWRYIKDQAVSSGSDAAWIDQITFPPVFNNNILLGDVNGDSTINIQDIIITVNLILSTSDYLESADMNSDNVVDILDVINLVNLILSN
tara:strand:- start:3490 stop:6471 length:2982 start_codon:yes stop_codon:yes gene_type:complete